MWILVVTLLWTGEGYAPEPYRADDMFRAVREKTYTFQTERACRAMGRRLATDPAYKRRLEPHAKVIVIQDCRRLEPGSAPPPPG